MLHYNIDTEESINKFIQEFIPIRNKLVKEMNLEVIKYNNLKGSIISKDIDLLLDDDSLFNDVIKNALKVIKYLTINNVTNVPQYNEAINELNDYIEVCDSKISLLEINLERISNIEFNNISKEDLKLFLDNSSLSDNEKLNVLMDTSYVKSFSEEEVYQNEDKETKQVKKIESKEELETFDVIDNDIEIIDVESNISIAKKIIKDYDYIFKNQTNRVKMIRKSQFFWIDALKKNIDLNGIDNYTKFEILLYKLKEIVEKNNINEIDNILYLFNKIKSKVDG